MGSISFAIGCSPPDIHLFSQDRASSDMVTGEATWYASTCRQCPAGCGVLAKNREGRIIKLEGNPLHPVNRGALCQRGQAALQDIYHPDRLKTPLLRQKNGWRPISFPQAEAVLKNQADRAAAKGSDRVRMLTGTIGDSLMQLATRSLQNLRSAPPLVYEPYAYESLKAANEKIFNVDGLIAYRMEKADVLVSFGADFLETWLSPVEYARKFKTMHTLQGGTKNIFYHVGPCLGLTGANADHWLACRPGSEAIIALGLVRQALDIGKGQHLPRNFYKFLDRATTAYTQDQVLQRSGITLALYEKLIIELMGSRRPLVLGTGTGACDRNGRQTNLAANLLNLLLDPQLRLLDFKHRYRVAMAAGGADILEFFSSLTTGGVRLLLLHGVNPAFSLPPGSGVAETLKNPDVFVVSFSNFMDETAALADLVLPVQLPLESWDEYSGRQPIVSTLQPAMGRLNRAPHLGDLLLRTGFEKDRPAESYKDYLIARLASTNEIVDEARWVQLLQRGGHFDFDLKTHRGSHKFKPEKLAPVLDREIAPLPSPPVFIAMPSIRFFDGRDANKPWLCEIADPLSRVAWQTPLLVHPRTAGQKQISQGDIVRIRSESGSLEAPVYLCEWVGPDTLAMAIGQGHTAYGRYAAGTGVNPFGLLDSRPEPGAGIHFSVATVALEKTGRRMKLAHTDGSRTQHGRTYALRTSLKQLRQAGQQARNGLSMHDFPLTLPLPEGYDPRRDFYPAHPHATYRWGMVVDLDRCIGCGACAAACYAENNIGIVGVERVLEGREMAWLSIERYQQPARMEKITFLPMLCQHCDNAPCEAVCPVYAPHHSKEGINNQIYNRCIGTRFCVQNCPYKVRRFNWFDWRWPEPLDLQLNPNVTVRSKGVMEKCSFCIQRIKTAHQAAKNQQRKIRDGEVTPACVQTCPTGALVFGNLADPGSRVRKQVDDPRAYQVMGYLNTKPAVIYLKKVVVDT